MSADRGYKEMPVQIKEAVDAYKRVHGRRVPLNKKEARSREFGSPTEHPYDSVMDEARLDVVKFFDDGRHDPNEHEDFGQVTNRNMVDDPDIVTDGGYEAERMKVYSLDETDVDEVVSAASGYDGADAYKFGEEGFALAGERGKVNELVWEIRQELGADMTQKFFDKATHDRVPDPENGEITAYDMSEVDREGLDPYFGGTLTQGTAADGSGDKMISFAGEKVYHDGDQNNPSDVEGRMGI